MADAILPNPKRPTDNSDVKKFKEFFENVIETFYVQNAKYKDSWKNDGLDARALFVQINSKCRRLKGLSWDEAGWQQMDSPEHRAKTMETCRDMTLYALMLWRRLELEFTLVPKELLDLERDKT